MALTAPQANVFGSTLGFIQGFSPTTTTTTGSSSGTSTQQIKLDQAGYDKIIQDILGSEQGLASLATGENLSGGYGSSVKAQLAQDLVLNVAGELAKITAPTVTTTDQKSKSKTKKKTSVICTELNRQGYLPDELYDAGYEHFASLDPRTIAGYRIWANKIVPRMQWSARLTRFFAPIALARYNYIVHKKFSLIGAATVYIGQPICFVIGGFLSEETVNGYLSTTA